MDRVYVAGKWEDQMQVREVQHVLRQFGVEITHDWTSHTEASLASQAAQDITAVRRADYLVWYIGNRDLQEFAGSWAEVGAALGLGKTVFFIADRDLKDLSIQEDLSKWHPVFLFHSSVRHFEEAPYRWKYGLLELLRLWEEEDELDRAAYTLGGRREA